MRRVAASFSKSHRVRQSLLVFDLIGSVLSTRLPLFRDSERSSVLHLQPLAGNVPAHADVLAPIPASDRQLPNQ